MKKLASALLLLVVASFSAPHSALAATRPGPAIPSADVARFGSNYFPDGRGFATSTVLLLASGGRVAVQIVGRAAGERWALELYDQGTCSAVRHRVLTLPDLVIGSDRRRSVSLSLTSAARAAVIYAFTYRTLVVRLAHGSYQTCRRFFPTVPSPT